MTPFPNPVERCPNDGWPPVEDLSGQSLVGRYTLNRLIGVGGMGSTVWLAEQNTIARKVAVKLLPGGTEVSRGRFQREARIASSLRHRHIVTIYDYGATEDNHLFLAMTFLTGQTLEQLLRESPRLPVDRALHIAAQVLRALSHAHGKRIVHRDLKPSNLFLTKEDDDPYYVKVLDFGLAKYFPGEGASHEGTPLPEMDVTGQRQVVCGTPSYMAPEQWRGHIDARTDVYALGTILFRMLTGSLPFSAPTDMVLYHRLVTEDAPSVHERCPEANCPPLLEDIVRRALARDPSERYADAREMRLDLEKIIGRDISDPGDAQTEMEESLELAGKEETPRERAVVAAGAPTSEVLFSGPQWERKHTAWLVLGVVLAVAAVLVALIPFPSQAPASSIPSADSREAANPPELASPGAVASVGLNPEEGTSASQAPVPSEPTSTRETERESVPVASEPAVSAEVEVRDDAIAKETQVVAEDPPTELVGENVGTLDGGESQALPEGEQTTAVPAPDPGVEMEAAETPVLVQVHLGSEPTGATILLGEEERGVTPLTLSLAPGAYEFELRKQGHRSERIAVVLDEHLSEAGYEKRITLAAIPRPTRSREVRRATSTPRSARVPQRRATASTGSYELIDGSSAGDNTSGVSRGRGGSERRQPATNERAIPLLDRGDSQPSRSSPRTSSTRPRVETTPPATRIRLLDEGADTPALRPRPPTLRPSNPVVIPHLDE